MMSGIRALDRKLLRDVVRVWPQALAIALVLASGVATLILAIGAYRSLEETRRLYYAEYAFADVFATLTRAPRWLEARIQEMPGVAVAEARIADYAVLDIEGMPEPATGLALSLPDHKRTVLNRPYVRAGRAPEPAASSEVMVNEAFAKAHAMQIGDKFVAILNGRKRALTVVGIALSPEYIYAIGPGDLMHDHWRLAVLCMSELELDAARAEAEGKVTEIDIEILRRGSTRREEANAQLRDLGYRELELAERRRSLIEQIDRLDIRAPVAGIVHALQVTTPRSVIRPAEPVLYIVPQDRPLVIAAQVAPIHVDEVAIGQAVALRFAAFDSRTTPELFGQVRQISADALIDEASRASYYRAEIVLDPGERDKLNGHAIIPGMPVEVFIRTGERTPLAYLVRPLAEYFNRAFRES
jgi:multidrug efflux pump subunit AcrA (membrane-fusion protein)